MSASYLSIKKRTIILSLSLCFLGGLFIGGFGGVFSSYYHFSKPNKRPHHLKFLFKYIDKEPQDSRISQQEALKFSQKIFTKLDDNEDNLLSLDELPKKHLSSHPRNSIIAPLLTKIQAKSSLSKEDFSQFITTFFQQHDINKDTFISFNEIQKGFQQHVFKQLDLDNNGVLSVEEFSAHKPDRSRFKRRNRHHKNH